jgi:hypothetical protein
MPTSSTQGRLRFSFFFALASFIGCGLFSAFYFYKESEFADTLAKQADQIKETEIQCAAVQNTGSYQSACALLADRRRDFHRNQVTRQAYRDKASAWLVFSCALPPLTLAIARWWYWILTGRFRRRKRQKK